MKLTNKFNIPKTFVNVLERPTYNKGKSHISATQLLNSPKIVTLTTKYNDEIEQDVSDMVWSLFGSAMHGVLEHGKDDNHIVEQRLHAELDGWQISGAVDLQVVDPDGIHIKDYKTTSVWSVMNEKIEWEQQLNIYAWLVAHNKQVNIKSLGIVAILRDWKAREVGTKDNYPESPIKELPIRLWTYEQQERFILERIAFHSACEFALEANEDLPDCTPQEMWEKPTSWAVIKKGNTRAKAVYEFEEFAKTALNELGDGYEIQVRPGERTRCMNYCPVNRWCKQWKDYQNDRS